jgi:hypothetical protein
MCPHLGFFIILDVLMKEIKLTQGKVALVDDEDYESLNKHKWYAKIGKETFYAVRAIYGTGKQKNISMHRVIMGITDPKIPCDHRDNDGLNNQRNNLRVCSNNQNQANARKRKNTTSKYKGVSIHTRVIKDKTYNSWQARIIFNGKSYCLGYYKAEEQAATAYNKKAIEFFGEFAKINEL